MRDISRLKAVLALAPALWLTACASTTQLGGDPGIAVVPSGELPAPDINDFTTDARPYLVGPFDKLTIDVFGIEELNAREVQVDAAGRISFPLAGIVQVAGHSPDQIEQLIADKLRAAYVRNPQVTVNLKEAISQVVTIEGQVKKPGLYPVLGRMTLLRAIATAEGTLEFSNLKDVVIFRTVKGRNLAALYDLDRIRHGAYADPEIYPNDVVMVGENRARRLFKDVLTTLSLVSGPIVVTVDRAFR
jgi:polysaccharide export outer membrane protein